VTGPAPELVDAGYAVEIADAPLLHRGLTLADLAHVLTLADAGLIPAEPARALLGVLLGTLEVPAEEFGYDPADGEMYASRERRSAELIGTAAGWLHAGRTRREAMRIALRLHLREVLAELVDAAAGLAGALAELGAAHTETWMPDQTYLQHAQPTTFGHYALSFADPVLRDARRLEAELDVIDASPAGVGSVNGTALLPDRTPVAERLGFASVIEHARDAMWQTDGFVAAVSAATSLLVTCSSLAEDLEIYASQEFGWVRLADGYSRSSVLLPQKRNPYALSMIRGQAGSTIGRLTGLLAARKTPSARSDTLIVAYGEVPRSLAVAARTTRLAAGVVRTLEVDAMRLWTALSGGFAQASDLAEHVMVCCGIDYRSAHRVVGAAVRSAAARGLRGLDLTSAALDDAGIEVLGHPLGLDPAALARVLDPREVVRSRTCRGGAAPGQVARMAVARDATAAELAAAVRSRRGRHAEAEAALVATARDVAAGVPPG
jgi:argininosuccinate lyase